MPLVSLVLASRSPARLATLASAGVTPEVVVSDVDEPAVLAAARAGFGQDLEPADAVLVLAQAKAEAVGRQVEDEVSALVLGCDSMLELDGEIVGKPADADEARRRWRAMRGRSGVLHTGHWVVDARDDEDGGTGATLGASSATTVHFADLDDEEIDAYVATGEPLHVAGAFTIDGLGGPYIERVEGDHHGVVGLSLPLLRELLGELDVAWRDLRG
ncbi:MULTISPECIES: Maf family protein [unclassified Isoptericola]|uniref:Maf family protein n=1 Tax=unclassified Isoptericola TaxID=2623355 RepID=UPI0036631750